MTPTGSLILRAFSSVTLQMIKPYPYRILDLVLAFKNGDNDIFRDISQGVSILNLDGNRSKVN